MKNLLPTLLASLFCAGLFAQNFTAKNSFTAGNTGTDEIRDITTDANGNIYITGPSWCAKRKGWCALAARSNTKREIKKQEIE